MMKIIGSILVMMTASMFGIRKAAKEQKRLEQGIELKRLLYLLKGEIRYGIATLPEAFEKISKKTKYEYSEFFHTLSVKLSQYQDCNLNQIWKETMMQVLSPYMIEKSYLDALYQLGETIGYLDQDMQMKTIEFAIEQIEDEILILKEEVYKNSKMYQWMGVSLGIFIVIILL